MSENRVPRGRGAGYPLKFHFQIPPFSPFDHKFAVPIYVICDYYIHKTDLADSSTFKKKKKKKFQIPCVFLDREFFGTFSLFSLCSGYPGGGTGCTLNFNHRF